MTYFERVLVANRGEIALRVMRTCRRLGIRTIAVYSDADRRALHVRHADEAHYIGPAPATESYLDQDAILRVAHETGAAALHPGYGFLSENAAFAERCRQAGVTWIGPSPEAMRALGDKANARALAESNGVPLLPGYHGADQSLPVLAEHAHRIGFPLLVKASAGGGGRGMRVVSTPEHLAEALDAARREATASFGDDRVLLERYVARPRHVEVQVLGDQHGNLVHLGERECSIQRRHQKLVEETPSPAVGKALRSRLGEAALTLARAAGYTSAGTVEFLLDEDGQFAFLEVNARLQVEHPVTEMVTGLDLVEQQLRVAHGEPLGFSQSDLQPRGHAVEARIIAEDPTSGFLPSAGRIQRWRLPDPVAATIRVDGRRERSGVVDKLPDPGDATIRVDSGVEAGSDVPPYYDSLLAKLIVHAPTRSEALDTLARALAAMRVSGVKTNLDLLLAVAEHPAFRAGHLHTRFLEEHHLLDSPEAVPPAVLAALHAVQHGYRPPGVTDPWRGPSAWRLAGVGSHSAWTINGIEHAVESDVSATGTLIVHTPDGTLEAEYLGLDTAAGTHSVRTGEGITTRVVPLDSDHHTLLEGVSVRWQGRTYRVDPPSPLQVENTERAGHAYMAEGGALVAPMPGRVVRVAVREGEPVAANQVLVVLEAMKMEHLVEAPHPGLVATLHVQPGQQVAAGAPLVHLSAASLEK